MKSKTILGADGATKMRQITVEFKYIHVMEIGKKGARHHHLVVNKIDTEILQRCWYKAYEGHKAEAEARGQQLPESDGFMNIPEGADEELPFN